MSEDEDEAELFIPDQTFLQEMNDSKEKIIEDLQKKSQRLQEILNQRQRHLQQLQIQYNMMKGSEHGYLLYIEQMRARRQPIWWFLLVVLSFICIFGSYDKGKWMATVLNVVGHKLLWRRLYVETNLTPQFISACIIAYTFVFV